MNSKSQLLEIALLEIRAVAHQVSPEARVHGRVKSNRSVLRKMRVLHLCDRQILDSIGVRAIVLSKIECYRFMERLHLRFETIAGEFDDYIRRPKPNGYRSLHTTILLEGKHPVEVQVRTQAMHRFAEVGAAAHASYKKEERVPDDDRNGSVL